MFWVRVRTCDDHDCAVIELHGELDLAGAIAVCGLLMTSTANEPVTTLDLTELDFMDCSGLGVLVRARQHATQFGHQLLLAAPNPVVRKVLGLTGANRQFPIYASVAAAVDAIRASGAAGEQVSDNKSALPSGHPSEGARVAAREYVVIYSAQRKGLGRADRAGDAHLCPSTRDKPE
jgi:anti-sigma B factor antagonist